MARYILLTIFLALGLIQAFSQCPEPVHPDYKALMALYHSTNGPEWFNNKGWAEGAAGNHCNPCEWYGITCYPSGRVGALWLAENNLKGTLPAEMGDLDYLWAIHLNHNQLSGPIPESLGKLKPIEVFLQNNQLSGPLPATIGGWYSTQFINLSHNQLSGPLPKEIRYLRPYELNLAHNQITGPIPEEIEETMVGRLLLHDNQLSGPLPRSLNNMRLHLRALYLHNNRLEGCLPRTSQYICSLGFSTNPEENGYNLTGNPKLAWQGHLGRWCGGGVYQIGAPCDDEDSTTVNDQIQIGCHCQGEAIVSTREPEETTSLLSPNPASRYVLIRGNLPHRVQLFHLSGALVLEVTPQTSELPLWGVSPGVYAAALHYANRVWVQRLIIH